MSRQVYECDTCHATYEDHYPTDDMCQQCGQGIIKRLSKQRYNEELRAARIRKCHSCDYVWYELNGTLLDGEIICPRCDR